MSKKRMVAIVALFAAGLAAPMLLPRELEGEFKLRWLFWAAAVLAGVLRDFGRAAQVASEVALPPDAVVVREGPANFKRGWVMVGGVLKMTPELLVFSSHGFAQKARVQAWPLADVVAVEPARTLWIVPNSIVVRMRAGELKFVVMDRQGWMSAIQAASAQRPKAAQA